MLQPYMVYVLYSVQYLIIQCTSDFMLVLKYLHSSTAGVINYLVSAALIFCNY